MKASDLFVRKDIGNRRAVMSRRVLNGGQPMADAAIQQLEAELAAVKRELERRSSAVRHPRETKGTSPRRHEDRPF